MYFYEYKLLNKNTINGVKKNEDIKMNDEKKLIVNMDN